MSKKLVAICCFLAAVALQSTANTHDVPGQPSHVLSNDPDAPPAVQVETHAGPYHVILTASPASPEPDERGTLTLNAFRSDDGQPYIGKVTFTALADSIFSREKETIGVQYIRDDIYRQGFLFKEAGHYILRAEFEEDGEPYTFDLPLTIGTPSSLGTVGVVVALLLLAVVTVNLVQRRRLQSMRTAA